MTATTEASSPATSAPPGVEGLVDLGAPAPGGWWARLTRAQRLGLLALGAVVALALFGQTVGGLVGHQPGGPPSSSYATGGEGLRAWSELLARRGHRVVREDRPLAQVGLAPTDVVVLADPGPIDPADVGALRTFVRTGGRLVVSGDGAASLVREVAGGHLRRGFGPGDGPVGTWVPVPEVRGVSQLAGDGGARLRSMAPLAGVAGDDTTAFVAVGDVGRGRMVVLASTGPLQNAHLGDADNAALGLSIVGPGPSRVVFAEGAHGFDAQGLAALPASWRWAMGLLAVALVLGLWSFGARFGPPEDEVRPLRPPRSEHVDAVAADLARVVRQPADLLAELDAGLDPPARPATDQDALALGAHAAARQRARHGLAPIATVPPDPHPPGAPS